MLEREIFSAGTAPGSPTTSNEIKTLICIILSEMGGTMSFSQIHETVSENTLVNYFELVDTLDSLIDSGHVKRSAADDIDYFAITDLGEKTAYTLDNSLPASVRLKAVEAANKVVARQNRLEEVRAEITRLDGGFQLEIAIPELKTNLVSFKLYAPTRDEAEKIRRNFLNDPIYIYKAIMALLSGDADVLGDLEKEPDKLF